MKDYNPQVVEEELARMFSPEWLRKTARETGLVKRERKVDPVVMFWVLTLSFGVRFSVRWPALNVATRRQIIPN
jgi:hypothetical protein